MILFLTFTFSLVETQGDLDRLQDCPTDCALGAPGNIKQVGLCMFENQAAISIGSTGRNQVWKVENVSS